MKIFHNNGSGDGDIYYRSGTLNLAYYAGRGYCYETVMNGYGCGFSVYCIVISISLRIEYQGRGYGESLKTDFPNSIWIN